MLTRKITHKTTQEFLQTHKTNKFRYVSKKKKKKLYIKSDTIADLSILHAK